MGGFIGIELAIRFPERVERLVLVSAAGLSIEYLRNERALAVLGAVDNRLAAYTGWLASRSETLARRPRRAAVDLRHRRRAIPSGCPARSSPSRSAARASPVSCPRSTRSPTTRSAIGWARSPARR